LKLGKIEDQRTPKSLLKIFQQMKDTQEGHRKDGKFKL
jgi:hypothetical protein